MIKRKKVLTLGVILCVIGISLSAVAYGVEIRWNPQNLATWMWAYGRNYITMTHNDVHYSIEPAVDDIHEMVAERVDQEAVEIQILPLEYTTFLGFTPPTPSIYQSTSIGGSDMYSGVYVMPTMAGFKSNVGIIIATVMDGGTYEWEVEIFNVDIGWYYVFIEAPDGVDAGSYLVEVYVRVYDSSSGEGYRGRGYYVIDCTATTNGNIE